MLLQRHINKRIQISDIKRFKKIYQANTSHEKTVTALLVLKQSELQGKDQMERHFIMIKRG